MTPRRYKNASAFRTSLEEHLLRMAREAGTPLDRLRKEVAHQRFLARLARAAPAGSWVLKGGQVLLARLGEGARATRDTDATWRASSGTFAELLETVVEIDLDDYFTFEVGEPRSLTAETEDGGLRYKILALLDGRLFERLQLDVNFVPADSRPIEYLRLRGLLGFAGIESPEVPVVPVAQHLAEKLHGYTREYGEKNSRPRDLFDMLVIASSLTIPCAGALAGVCRTTFDVRQSSWPPQLASPPATWRSAWTAYVQDYRIPWRTLDDAGTALFRFWTPVLEAEATDRSLWVADDWTWRRESVGE